MLISGKTVLSQKDYDINGQRIVDKLGQKKIPENKILLHPRLLEDSYSEDK